MTTPLPPLWKQLLSAGTGALVALALYGVYEGVVPSIEAYLVPKETLNKETLANRRNVPAETQERFDRIAKKTRAMVERFESENDTRALEEQLANMAIPKEQKDIVSTEPPAEPVPVMEVAPAPTFSETPLAAAVMAESSPSLPESGVAMTFGVLAASVGGVLTLWRRNKAS